MFRRNRFADLVARRLDMFCEENADLLAEIAEFRDRWRRDLPVPAPSEAFGDEQDRVDCAAEALSDVVRARAPAHARRGDGGRVPARLHVRTVRRRLPARADVLEAERRRRRCSRPDPVASARGALPPLRRRLRAQPRRPRRLLGRGGARHRLDVRAARACSTADARPLYRWFTGGELNTCHNALDRHVDGGRGDQPALIYDSPVTGHAAHASPTRELRDEVARLAGALRGLGVEPRRPGRHLHADGARGA